MNTITGPSLLAWGRRRPLAVIAGALALGLLVGWLAWDDDPLRDELRSLTRDQAIILDDQIGRCITDTFGRGLETTLRIDHCVKVLAHTLRSRPYLVTWLAETRCTKQDRRDANYALCRADLEDLRYTLRQVRR